MSRSLFGWPIQKGEQEQIQFSFNLPAAYVRTPTDRRGVVGGGREAAQRDVCNRPQEWVGSHQTCRAA